MSFQDYDLPSIETIDLGALMEKLRTLTEAAKAIDPREIEAVSRWAGSFTTDNPVEHIAHRQLLGLASRYVNGVDSLRTH